MNLDNSPTAFRAALLIYPTQVLTQRIRSTLFGDNILKFFMWYTWFSVEIMRHREVMNIQKKSEIHSFGL